MPIDRDTRLPWGDNAAREQAMGNKDFTDWNGRKRKEVVRPMPERANEHRRTGKKEKVGLKTKVDRYKSLLKDLAQYKKWHREYWERRRECESRQVISPHYKSTMWGSSWISSIRRLVKKLRGLKEQYRRDGTLEQVMAAVRSNPNRR